MQRWVRTGPQTIKAKGEVLRQLNELATRVPFDDRRHLTAHVENVSPLLVRRFLREIGSKLVDQEPIDNLDLYRKLRLLQRLNGTEVPRNFALLFFNEQPHEFFRGAWIEVPDQIQQVLHYLEGLGGTLIRKVRGQAKARRSVAYPFEAVEEAVVNAVHHRGYDEVPEPVKIYLYPDRMEVRSYPGPIPGLRLDHFSPGAIVPPVPGRNRRVGELLKELRLAEATGTGVPKIQNAMRRNGSPPAQFDFDEETRTYFNVILPMHPDHRKPLEVEVGSEALLARVKELEERNAKLARELVELQAKLDETAGRSS
jgi:ATP-dependent DNA helicase RecG